MRSTQHEFRKLTNKLRNDKNVLGLWLGGSRAKGYDDETSDYDLLIIVEDNVDPATFESALKNEITDPDIGVSVKTLEALKEYAIWGRHDSWVRYSFSETKALFDRNGEVQKVIDDIGTFPRDKQKGLIRGALDAYQNSLYRSLKASKRNQEFAFIIEANQSVEHLLAAVFALHLKFKPYPSYVEHEVNTLEYLGDFKDELMGHLKKIVTTGDPDTQLLVRSKLRDIFKKEGFGEGFDIWDETLDGFLKKYNFTVPF